MKKIIFLFLIGTFFFAGCKKDTKTVKPEITSAADDGIGGDNGSGFKKLKKITLIDQERWPVSHYYNSEASYFRYNKNGALVTIITNDSSMSISPGLSSGPVGSDTQTFSYNSDGKLTGSKFKVNPSQGSQYYYDAAGKLVLLTYNKGTGNSINDSTKYTYTNNFITGTLKTATSTATYYYSQNLDSVIVVDGSNNIISKIINTYSSNPNLAQDYIYYNQSVVIKNSNELLRTVIYNTINGILDKQSSTTFIYTYNSFNYPINGSRVDTNYQSGFSIYDNPNTVSLGFEYY